MDPTVTDWISAIAAALTALFTAGLLLAALGAGAVAAWTLIQMRRDSRERREDSARATRPYVGARLVPSLGGLDSWDLIVHNSGRTAAHNLELKIEADEVPSDMVTDAVYRFAAAGLTLHPAATIRTYWSVGASAPERKGFPRAVVTVRYRDGVGEEGENYEEVPVVLDPDDVGLSPVPSQGPDASGNDKHTRNIVNALRAIARNVGEGNR